MSNMMAFNLNMPREMLEELALNVHGIEGLSGVSMAGVLSMIENVVSIGLHEYLDEDDEFTVSPAGNGGFTIKIERGALSDVALNMHGMDGIEGADSAVLTELMGDVLSAGLDELLGYSEGFAVTPA